MLSAVRCSSRHWLAQPTQAYSFRCYAAAAAATQRNSPTSTASSVVKSSKATAKASAKSSSIKPTATGKHDPASPTAKLNASSASTSASHKAAAVAATASAIPTPNVEPPAESSKQEPSSEEQLAQLDKLMMMQRLYPGTDIWGQKMETLDVQIPYSTQWKQRKHYPSMRAMREQVNANFENGLKSAVSLYRLALVNGIPGVDLDYPTWSQRYFKWPIAALKYGSTKPDSWMSPFRNLALDTYKSVNTALAQGDTKTIKRLTTDSFQESSLRLLKNRNPHHRCIWRYHKDVIPPRVLSFRCTEGYLAADEPKIGNRMIVQALVKFDSEQSIEMYDRQGRSLGQDGMEAKRVTEYLVFERRMWYDTPWVIREQMYEAVGKAPVKP